MAHAHAQLPPQPTRLHLADLALEQRWSRMRLSVYGPLDLALAVLVAALALGGYPSWRVGAVAGVLLALVGLQVFEARRSRAGLETAASARAIAEWLSFGLQVGVLGLTGGLRSPFLVFLVLSIPVLMVQHGWSRLSKVRVGCINASALALALLPEAWVGPALGGSAYAASAAAAVVLFGMTVAHWLGALLGAANTSIRDAFRAREEIADHALARARDLEHIGARLSHELKNPLASIKALVQLSLRAPEGADHRERLDVVHGEVERMQGILQDYLSFTRPLEKLQRGRVALGPLADEVLAALEARATEAGVALRRRGEARVEADPRRIKEALINLVANALEASPPGAQVEVAIAEGEEVVALEVRDRGRGMSAEVLERVGTPFFTTREEGTGLGVALARATFAQHGGALDYRSAPGEGTTARATLPARGARRSDEASAGGR